MNKITRGNICKLFNENAKFYWNTNVSFIIEFQIMHTVCEQIIWTDVKKLNKGYTIVSL